MSKKNLKSTKFFKPYTGSKCTLKFSGCGVYIIKKNGIVVYVGMSKATVKETLYRHFQQWNDYRNSWARKFIGANFERVTYANDNREYFKIKVIFTPTEREANILEQLLILKLKPKDNTLKLMAYSQTEYDRLIGKLNDSEEVPF